MHRPHRPAFTLVELLVVITIIVVLLALLTPALDQAIYQAELTVCASKLKTIASAAHNYAASNNRSYPIRKWVEANVDERPILLAYLVNALTPIYGNPDDRPTLRPYFPITKTLMCPLTEEVPLEPPGIDPDTSPYSSYALWFGFRYRSYKGLRRLGDHIEYDGQNLRVLAGDWDGTYEDSQTDINTHPDRDGKLFSTPARNHPFFGIDAKASYSFWHTVSGELNRRGPVEMNHAFTDGAVQRYNQVKKLDRGPDGDERMVNLPARLSGSVGDVWRVQVPYQ